MYGVISLTEEEFLLCLFFRGDGEIADTVSPRDFERRMHQTPPEGGISFFRAQTTDYREMIDRVKRTRLLCRGIATVSVGQLLKIGFQLCGDLEIDDKHVCIHCLDCNCAKDDCRPSGQTCSFISPENVNSENDRMRRLLADAMSVIIEARNTRTDLLEIFGTDVDGTVAERNTAYAQRWEAAQRRTSPESLSR